jgi:DNA-binding transcriptional regulator/RsmH inhibitor MraZ
LQARNIRIKIDRPLLKTTLELKGGFYILSTSVIIKNMDEKQKQTNEGYLEALSAPDFAGPTKPLHLKMSSSDERTKEMEEHIRNSSAFEGRWQSYMKDFKLVIPQQLVGHFNSGGVVTVSTENHLLIFGTKHWDRMQRILAKEIGLSPVHNGVARHYYSNMYRFNRLNEDSTLDLPLHLIQYASLAKEVAIIGMVYHAEIHDKTSYVTAEKVEKKSLLDRFRKIKFN